MEIKILGPGCARCENLGREVFNALAELDVAARVMKIKDIEKIAVYKNVAIPALVINDRVKVSGQVPTREEIKKYIKEEMGWAGLG
ncbi:MAG: thioredoxin family protein [Syntrophomonadaceae bacterium]